MSSFIERPRRRQIKIIESSEITPRIQNALEKLNKDLLEGKGEVWMNVANFPDIGYLLAWEGRVTKAEVERYGLLRRHRQVLYPFCLRVEPNSDEQGNLGLTLRARYGFNIPWTEEGRIAGTDPEELSKLLNTQREIILETFRS